MDEDSPDSFYLIQRIGESLLNRARKLFRRKRPMGTHSSFHIADNN
jgi:hypothetical protein